jgi:multiple sugar transport system substrate-binding protein
MVEGRSCSRRAVLRGLGAIAIAPILAACSQPSATPVAKPAATAARAPEPAVTKPAAAVAAPAKPAATGPVRMNYWVYQFLKESDDFRVEFGKKWAAENNVILNQSLVPWKEFMAKITAGIEAGTTPDVVESGAVQLRGRGQLLEVTDIYQRLEKEQGGWVGSSPKFMLDPNNKVHHILWGFAGSLMISRSDLLQQAGFKEPPKTWEDLLAQAKKAQRPPQHYGWAQPVSNQTDSNVWEMVMKSYGARLADKDGKKIVLGEYQKEVWAFLDYFDQVWEANILPPGVVTWDNTMNNSTYQAGKAIFATNPITINLWLAENNAELLAKTSTYPLPTGPKEHIWWADFGSRSIMKQTTIPDVAKKFLYDAMEPKKMEAEYGVSQWGPVLKSFLSFPVWKDPKKEFMQGLVELSLNGSPMGYPDVFNDAWSEQATNTTISRMLQRIKVDNWPRDKAFAEAIDVLGKTYEKYAG